MQTSRYNNIALAQHFEVVHFGWHVSPADYFIRQPVLSHIEYFLLHLMEKKAYKYRNYIEQWLVCIPGISL